MPEHLRALVVILAIATLVFWLAKKPLVACGMAPDDFKRRRNLWFGVTLAAFLAHNFWLYALLVAAMVVVYGLHDRNPVALYVVLLFAVPPFSAQIPGFGLINYVFELNHIRLLNLTLLLGALLRFRSQGGASSDLAGTGAAGKLLLGYLSLLVALTMILDSITGTMRTTFMLVVDVWLPFYVAYLTLRSRPALRDTAAAFVLAGALLAAIALFEFAKTWLLYATLDHALGVPWGMSNYMARGDGGALRALASTGHSIVLGYVLVVALACAILLSPRLASPRLRGALYLLLSVGLVVSLSRGPWVGAALMLVVALGIGRGAASRLFKLGLAGAAAAGLLLMLPWGARLIDYLPFIGTVDAGSVDYRSRLIEVSLGVLSNSPFFGAWDYMLNPAMEEMRQGEGIIDIVNTYLGVAMSTGLVGLSLFVGVFVAAAWATWKAWRSAGTDAELERFGRCLLAALAGATMTIATVSPINAVPTVYWLLTGVMLAYSRVAALAPVRSDERTLRGGAQRRSQTGTRSGSYAA